MGRQREKRGRQHPGTMESNIGEVKRTARMMTKGKAQENSCPASSGHAHWAWRVEGAGGMPPRRNETERTSYVFEYSQGSSV